jgi:RND superfamily putative drug exporter
VTGLLARRARAIVALTAVVAVVALALGGTVVGVLDSGSDQFEDAGSESSAAIALLERETGRQPDPGIIAVVRSGDAAAVRERIADEPAVGLAVVRGDLVFGFLRGTGEGVDAAVARLRETYPDGGPVVLGGGAVVARQVSETVERDLTRAELIAFPVVFLLSLWVFRGLVAALLPPFVGAASIAVTLLGLRLLSEATSVSVFALNLVVGLGFGLAIDYSLFMVSRYREELERGGHTVETLRRTVTSAGRTVVFSALTVAAAMASVLVFPQPFLRSMGLGGVLVALSAGLVALVPLPALLHLLGPRVNALAPRRWQRPPSGGGWARLSRWVMRRPGAVALGSAAVLVALALPALGVRFTGVDASALPTSTSGRVVADILDERGIRGSVQPVDVVFRGAPPAGAAERAREVDDVAVVQGARQVAPALWVLTVGSREDALAPTTQRLVRELRSTFPAALVTGHAAAYADQQASLREGLPWALVLLFTTTFALLFAFTGSVVLPLKAILMNVLTIGAAFGILVLVFQDALGERGLESTQPILLAATAFGLSTDYGVFLLSRIQEARRRGLGDVAAVAEGLERTGRIITAAALLFCVAIGAFATSRLVFVQQLGLGTAAAVALDATIVRALLVPSLMALLGRWNWWAPRPLRRLHARLGLQE